MDYRVSRDPFPDETTPQNETTRQPRPPETPILEVAHPSHHERSKHASDTPPHFPVTVRSAGTLLLVGIVLVVVGIVSLVFSAISWVSGVVPSVVLAAGHSLAPHLIMVYHEAHSTVGDLARASQSRFRTLRKLPSNKDPPRFFIFGSPSSQSRRALANTSDHVPWNFRPWFEADFDIRHHAVPHHFVRPPDWRINFVAMALDRSACCCSDTGWLSRPQGRTVAGC